MDNELMQVARVHAGSVLLANGGELGLLGSNQAYQQVWARDSMICGLGLWCVHVLIRNMGGPFRLLRNYVYPDR